MPRAGLRELIVYGLIVIQPTAPFSYAFAEEYWNSKVEALHDRRAN